MWKKLLFMLLRGKKTKNKCNKHWCKGRHEREESVKARHGTEASGGGRSAPATLIKLGFKPEEDYDYDHHHHLSVCLFPYAPYGT